MPFVKVATLAEVPSGRAKPVSVQGWQIALIRVNDHIHAIADCCPHKQLPLSPGLVAGCEIVCPWHAARFDITTGAVLGPPARSAVRTFQVQVVGDDVEVEVP
jgi:nitrite reductase/ring-hydroxylating ferredoxin subunit